MNLRKICRGALAIVCRFSFVVSLLTAGAFPASAAPDKKAFLDFAVQHDGDVSRGQKIFNDTRTACVRCHTVDGSGAKAGPDLSAIGDKFDRPELVRCILEPSSTIVIGFSTTILETKSGESYEGILKQATGSWIELMGADEKLIRIPTAEIKAQRNSELSLMPENIESALTLSEFADLVAYLGSLHQPVKNSSNSPAMPEVIPVASHAAELKPFFDSNVQLRHPTDFAEMPGFTNRFVVIEQAGKSWVIERTKTGDEQTALIDLSGEVRTGGGCGLLGITFHLKFRKNRKYYLKYQVEKDGEITTRIVERKFARDFKSDSGEEREIIRIPAVTQDHTGGAIAFGPDGFLYIGMGDTGPQNDPQGHAQDLSLLLGKILRIDLDHAKDGRAYAIPKSNPFRKRADVRPEIWAYGFREPWRFSFDPASGDLWVGDVGQNQFEEITLARAGENHGWNVFEGVTPFSERYRRGGENFVPPVFTYSHRKGVSVTGGFVYRGQRAPALKDYYICGDFETRRLWALTQTNRTLANILEIGRSPGRIVSFAQDSNGELYVVGHDTGIIYQLDLAAVNTRPLQSQIIAATSETAPVLWRYTLQTPASDWRMTGFDDSSWTISPGGFGTAGTPGAVVRTEWNTKEIWLRRNFSVPENILSSAQTFSLRLHHDEDVEVYLNGVEISKLPRWTTDYIEIPLSDGAAKSLHSGQNLLAIHCRQNSGGQYIDAGLVAHLPRETKD